MKKKKKKKNSRSNMQVLTKIKNPTIGPNAKFIVICKPRTSNDGGEDSVQ